MTKSESIQALAKALIEFHRQVGIVKKSETNPFFKSKYADLSTILDAIKSPLENAGLTFSQFPTGENELTTILMHGDSGEWMEDTFKMTPVKNDPQGAGSVITYQRRYALGAILGLNIDEDDDGNKASAPVQAKPAYTQKPYQKPVTTPAPTTPAATMQAAKKAALPAKPISNLVKLKDKLQKAGAKTEDEALKILADKTGALFANLSMIDEATAGELLNAYVDVVKEAV